MLDQELAFASAFDLLDLISTREISPVELTELYYSRIERLDPQLNAFLTLTRDEAMERARSAEKAIEAGEETGPLHGLPISVKDTQMTRGHSHHLGVTGLQGQDTGQGCCRGRAGSGCRCGDPGENQCSGVRSGWAPVRTAWAAPDAIPGTRCERRVGSSGGAAAALAASLCPLATGSDGGGSIRIPAHFCGIYGIKPTQGRVSGYAGGEGHTMPYIFSQNGPLSRTVRDAALLLQTLSGHDSRDPTSLRQAPPDFVAAVDREVRGMRVAWSPDFGFAEVDPEVSAVTSSAALVFEELGCHLEESDLAMDPPYDTFGPIIAADFFAMCGVYLETHADQLTEIALFFLEQGAKVTAAEYARTLALIDLLKARMTDFFEEFDLLLSPDGVLPRLSKRGVPRSVVAPQEPTPTSTGTVPSPFRSTSIGHPAASVPAGFSRDGLPIGLQIVGRKGGEETVLAASAALERARPWIQHRPPVS